MPEVAFDTNPYPLGRADRPLRSGTVPGHAPASSFASMLDARDRPAEAEARTAVDRQLSRAPGDSAPGEPAGAATAGDAKAADDPAPPGDARPADARPADAKAADGASPAGESGGTGAAGPAALSAAKTQVSATKAQVSGIKAQVDPPAAAAESGPGETAAPAATAQGDEDKIAAAASEGDGEAVTASRQSAESAEKPAQPEASDGGGDKAADDVNAGAGKPDGSNRADAKTGAAIAPTPPAAAHSENAANAADAAKGRTPPAAAAALQAAAGKPADGSARKDDAKEFASANKGSAKELPEVARGDALPKAEGAPPIGENKAAAAQSSELPAHARRDAATDGAAPLPSNGAQATARPGADSTQPLTLPPPLHQQPPSPAPAAPPAAPQALARAAAVPLAGVAIEIAGKAFDGKNRFEIRLDPPELGRIEVRLDVDRDGRVTSHLVADRKDTLGLLQRDAAVLQRALQDAGLKTADNGLHFSLRDQSAGQQDEQAGRSDALRLVAEDETLPAIETVAGTRFTGRKGGIDIRV